MSDGLLHGHLHEQAKHLHNRGCLELRDMGCVSRPRPPSLVDIRECITGALFVSNISQLTSSAFGQTFEKQAGRTACGLASLANLARGDRLPLSLGLKVPTPQWIVNLQSRVDQSAARTVGGEDSISSEAPPVVFGEATLIETLRNNKDVVPGTLPDSFEKSGLTLPQMRNILQTLLPPADNDTSGPRFVAESVHPPSISEDSCLKNSQDSCLKTLSAQIARFDGCLVNYEMAVLGQTGGCGHFSLAVGIGYIALRKGVDVGEEVSAPDAGPYILLMDPWPETPVCWVPWRLLLRAMDTVDGDSGEKRGMLVVRWEKENIGLEGADLSGIR